MYFRVSFTFNSAQDPVSIALGIVVLISGISKPLGTQNNADTILGRHQSELETSSPDCHYDHHRYIKISIKFLFHLLSQNGRVLNVISTTFAPEIV